MLQQRMTAIEDYYYDQSNLNSHGVNYQDNYEYLNQLNMYDSSNDSVLLHQQQQQQQQGYNFQNLPQQYQMNTENQILQYSHQLQPQSLQFYPPQLNTNYSNGQFDRNQPLSYDNINSDETNLNNNQYTDTYQQPVDSFQPVNQDFSNMRFYDQPQVPIQQLPIQQHFQAINSNDSTLALSPVSIGYGTPQLDNKSSTLSFPSTNDLQYKLSDNKPSPLMNSSSSPQRFKVIRGVSSGGAATKPPKALIAPDHHYVPVSLSINNATLNDLCLPQWSPEEIKDKRRIIRIERFQSGPKIIVQFSIVGSAEKNPTTLPPQQGVDVVEVSCLECFTRNYDDPED